MKKDFIKNFLFVIFMICFFLGSTVTASASAKLVLLKNKKTTTSYDVTGDGKKDKLSYNAEKGTVIVNGKSQKLFSGVKTASKVRVFYYAVNTNNEFILVEYAKSNAIKTSSGFRYTGGRFKKASEPMGGFNSCRIGKLSGNNLILYTSPSSGAATISFTSVSGKPFEYEETYKVNTTKHMIVRASNYGKIRSVKYFYFNQRESRYTSTIPSPLNRIGPRLQPGQKVKLGRVYFRYSGTDASKGSKVYEMIFSGNKGWVPEGRSVNLVINNPVKPQDFFKDVVYRRIYHPGDGDSHEAFLSFGNNLLGRSSGEHEFNGPNFKITETGDEDPFRPLDLPFEDYRQIYKLENTGNQAVLCAGVEIGMTERAAKASYLKEIAQVYPEGVYSVEEYYSVGGKKVFYASFGEEYVHVNCIELELKNNSIVSYEYYYALTGVDADPEI